MYAKTNKIAAKKFGKLSALIEVSPDNNYQNQVHGSLKTNMAQ
jgi:hypothetical protein